MISSHSSCILLISSLIFGYLNIGFSDNVGQTLVPRIWPNISDSGSFLQWPGIMGSGGLNISIYDAFAKIVNASGDKFDIPIFGVGNFTLMQIALIKAIGAIVVGAAAFITEAVIIKKNHDAQLEHEQHSAGYGGLHSYGPPQLPSNVYGPPPPSNKYGPAPPSNSYGPPTTSNTYNPSPSNSYGPPQPTDTYSPPTPSNSYSPPQPSDTYSPPTPSNSYGPPQPTDTYSPPTPSNSYSPPQPSDTYSPPTPSNSYGPPQPPDTYNSPPPSNSYG